jgi:hypothetical protein
MAGVTNMKSSTSTGVLFGAWIDRTRKTEQGNLVGVDSNSSAAVV